MRRLCLLLISIFVLAGCMEDDDSIWEHTAPTLAPTVSPLLLPDFDPNIPITSAGANNPIAAALPPNSSMPPVVLNTDESGTQTVQISLSSGETVLGYMFQQQPDELDLFAMLRSAGVLLLGEVGTVWGKLPDHLMNMGYTVLMVESPELTVDDFHQLFNSLQVAPLVDPGAMAVMGFGFNGDVALQGCAETLGCDALVLFNPSSDETQLQAMRQYSPRPVLIIAPTVDLRLRLAGESLFQLAQPNNSQLLLWNETEPTRFINDFALEAISVWLTPILEFELNYIPAIAEDGELGGFDLINPDLDAPIGFDIDFDFDFGLDDE
jgi:hypothetical protein